MTTRPVVVITGFGVVTPTLSSVFRPAGLMRYSTERLPNASDTSVPAASTAAFRPSGAVMFSETRAHVPCSARRAPSSVSPLVATREVSIGRCRALARSR